MSTIILIIVGVVVGLLLLVGIGYLLDRYGVTAKVKEGIGNLQKNYPTIRRWLTTGAIAVALLAVIVIILVIIF